jgi:ferric-dicitrate binding protein FerR (iron transport regulator)
MSNSIEQARALLEKYREGKCTDQEIELLHQWYGELEVLHKTDQEQMINKDELGDRLETAILGRINKPAAPLRRFDFRLVAAASIAGLLLLSGAYWLLSRNPAAVQPFAQVHRLANDSSAVKKTVLPDGTQVWLNAHSVLSWNEDFGKSDRKVQLEGEGYFDVVKDKEHPFLVEAKGVTTKVVGTVFNVEAYPGEERLRVALVEGKVELRQNTPGLPVSMLSPGQVGAISKGQSVFHITKEHTEGYGAWINGGLSLTAIPLEDALHRICNKYGYSLQGNLPPEERYKPVTARFEKESGEEIIESILYIHHIEFSIEQKKLIINP